MDPPATKNEGRDDLLLGRQLVKTYPECLLKQRIDVLEIVTERTQDFVEGLVQ